MLAMISGPAFVRPTPTVHAVAVAVAGSHFFGGIEEHKRLAAPENLLSWQSVCSSFLPQSKFKRETAIVTVVPSRRRSSNYLLLGNKERKRSRGYFKNFLPFVLKFRFANPTWSTTRKMLSVYLYIPNIIGYVRVFMNCIAFGCCSFNKKLFIFLYFISFVLDGVDGWLARKFNQVSTFGAVLDMVTDRVSTACLLVVLSQFYSPGLIFLSLLALDIASHWLQMYSLFALVNYIVIGGCSTFLSGKASHKDVKDSSSWLFKLYYGNRLFMAYCCVGTEVLYIILYFLGKTYSDSVLEVIMIAMKEQSLISILTALSLCGWAIKQAINLIQMKNAADACVAYDMTRRDRP